MELLFLGQDAPALLRPVTLNGKESIMFKRQLSLALVFGMAATAPPALAQTSCAHRDQLTESLSTKYNESQTGLGLQGEDKLLEVWTSNETGSWTILVTMANGMSCILATGANWLEAPQAVAVPKGFPS